MTQIDPISSDLSLLVSISPPGPILRRCVFPCGGLCMPRQRVINGIISAIGIINGIINGIIMDKAYLTILPKLRKDLQSIYLNRLLWIAQMKKDPIHKQIMKTKDAFANDDNFDPEEALEAAVDKRKFLMKRLFGDTRSTNTV